MSTSLLTLRNLARRLGSGLVFVFLWSSLVPMAHASTAQLLPASSTASHERVQHHDVHAAHHGHEQTPPPAQTAPHSHGDGTCCASGLSCSAACNLVPLLAVNETRICHGSRLTPLFHSPVEALSRPPQPPLRPPKA